MVWRVVDDPGRGVWGVAVACVVPLQSPLQSLLVLTCPVRLAVRGATTVIQFQAR